MFWLLEQFGNKMLEPEKCIVFNLIFKLYSKEFSKIMKNNVYDNAYILENEYLKIVKCPIIERYLHKL